MTAQPLPASTNFQVWYEDSIPNALARAQAIAAVCENEFTVLTGWFGIAGAFGTPDRIQVNLQNPGLPGAAAENFGYQSGGKSKINVDPQSANRSASNAAEIVKMLFINELVEVFMSYNNQLGANKNSWKATNSDGEALSQLCGIERYRTGNYLFSGSSVDSWLQNNGRPDFVTNPENTDRNSVSFGCGLLFLYYLKSQLGYSVPKIIQNGGSSLEALYKNLTGQSNAFAAFNGLVSQYFPAGNTPQFGTFDDPFPLLDPTYRSVSINSGADNVVRNKVASGTAHVSPFSAVCVAKDYSFEIDSTPTLVGCTATVRGFGQPVFAWRVNGTDVPAGGGSIGILANVLVDDTMNPQQHATMVKNITVNCTLWSPTSWASNLYIDVPAAVVGQVDLIIDALVTDRFAAPNVQTKVTNWITANNEEVVWEDQYYRDRDACHVKFADWVRRHVAVNRIPIWRTLPDPPPDYGRVIRQLGLINELIKEARGESKELARVSESMLRQVYGITPELVEQITNQQQRGTG